MKPTEADRLSVSPRIQSAAMPPTSANGTLSSTSPACLSRPKVTNSSRKMIAIESGTTRASRACRSRLVLELTAPRDPVPGREGQRMLDPTLRLGHEAPDVTPAYVGLHHEPALGVLVIDGFRCLGLRDARDA